MGPRASSQDGRCSEYLCLDELGSDGGERLLAVVEDSARPFATLSAHARRYEWNAEGSGIRHHALGRLSVQCR
jgi:hypothetical protein